MPCSDRLSGIQDCAARDFKGTGAPRGCPYPFTFRKTPLFATYDVSDDDDDTISDSPANDRCPPPAVDELGLDEAFQASPRVPPFHTPPAPSSPVIHRTSLNGRSPAAHRCRRSVACSRAQRHRGESAQGARATYRLQQQIGQPTGASPLTCDQIEWGNLTKGARAESASVTGELVLPPAANKARLSFILNAPGPADPPRMDSKDAHPAIPLPPPLVIPDCAPRDKDSEDGTLMMLRYPDSPSPHAISPKEASVPIARVITGCKRDVLSKTMSPMPKAIGTRSTAIASIPQTTTAMPGPNDGTEGDDEIERLWVRPPPPCLPSVLPMSTGGVSASVGRPRPPLPNNIQPYEGVSKQPEPSCLASHSSVSDGSPPSATLKTRSVPRPFLESDPAALGHAVLVFNDLVDRDGDGACPNAIMHKRPRLPRDTKFAREVNRRARQDAAKLGEEAQQSSRSRRPRSGACSPTVAQVLTLTDVTAPDTEPMAQTVPPAPTPCAPDNPAAAGASARTRTLHFSPDEPTSVPEPTSTPMSTFTSSSATPSAAIFSAPNPATPSAAIFSAPNPATLLSRRGRPLRPGQSEARARKDAVEQQKRRVVAAFKAAAAEASDRAGIFAVMVWAVEDERERRGAGEVGRVVGRGMEAMESRQVSSEVPSAGNLARSSQARDLSSSPDAVRATGTPCGRLEEQHLLLPTSNRPLIRCVGDTFSAAHSQAAMHSPSPHQGLLHPGSTSEVPAWRHQADDGLCDQGRMAVADGFYQGEPSLRAGQAAKPMDDSPPPRRISVQTYLKRKREVALEHERGGCKHRRRV